MSRITSFATAVTLAGGLVAGALAVTQANAHPNARINIDISQGGFIVGGTSGQGYVRYHRRNYPVKVTGLRFGAIVGGSTANLRGRVTNLSRLSDVEGTYSSIGASGSLVEGKNHQKYKNAHGVYLELHGVQQGAEFSLDVGSITLTLGR